MYVLRIREGSCTLKWRRAASTIEYPPPSGCTCQSRCAQSSPKSELLCHCDRTSNGICVEYRSAAINNEWLSLSLSTSELDCRAHCTDSPWIGLRLQTAS